MNKRDLKPQIIHKMTLTLTSYRTQLAKRDDLMFNVKAENFSISEQQETKSFHTKNIYIYIF